MAPEALGWWVGAAPGIAVALRTWWKSRALLRRLSAALAAECESAEPGRGPHYRFDLWLRPHCFVRREDSQAVVAVKREILTSRPRVVGEYLSGAVLGVVGGVVGSLVARGVA